MKKLNKLFIVVLCTFFSFIITGCNGNSSNKYTIDIIIEGIDNVVIYDKKIQTDKIKLVDVLEEIDVDLKIEEGNYGAYITSLMGIEQSTNESGIYYWSYYINDEYAQKGISLCKIKNNTTYKFVYEYYGN